MGGDKGEASFQNTHMINITHAYYSTYIIYCGVKIGKQMGTVLEYSSVVLEVYWADGARLGKVEFVGQGVLFFQPVLEVAA